jgi:2,3-bisphosphoglycerate-independent phosphoglycerate mutase
LIVDGIAPYTAPSATRALEQAYARGETDEFVKATAIRHGTGLPIRVEDGDIVVFANFRADRARQLTSAFTSESFNAFTRKRSPHVEFIAMTNYGAQYALPVAFPTVDITNTFGELLSRRGLRQLRIAETEKYAHVTFFFNGGEEEPFAGEDRILVPSPAVATYDLKPEMSAAEVTDRLIEAIASRTYDAIICNYANADMVGHTGDFAATVKCIETLDTCLGRIHAACRDHDMEFLITSDHGNAEQMRAPLENGSNAEEPHTAHTSNPVPLIYCGRPATLSDGCLSDIAPTMLDLMGLAPPQEMTGHSLVRLNEPGDSAASR